MTNWIRTAVACFAITMSASIALAQEEGDIEAPASAPTVSAAGGFSMDLGKSVGAGLVIIGAALGIGKIGGMAVEGMSRQPEAAGNIQTGMIIAAALIEGATFFALILILIS